MTQAERASAYSWYPSAADVEGWIAGLRSQAAREPVQAEVLDPSRFSWPDLQGLPQQYAARHHEGTAYVRFTPQRHRPFYGIWQPALNRPSRLVVHLPGYGAEMSVHPELVAAGYSVLHVSPLGYCTNAGIDLALTTDRTSSLGWPQLPATIASYGEEGYRDWFLDCLQAVDWALRRPEVIPGRISFFGTSQGGGAALILASMLRESGVRCVAADLPYLTSFPDADGRGAYSLAAKALAEAGDKSRAWRALGFIDTLSHAPRLSVPALVTAGGRDEVCPPDTIKPLVERLAGTRCFCLLAEAGHSYRPEFLALARAWFDLYA